MLVEILGYVVIAVVVLMFFAYNSYKYSRDREILIRADIRDAFGTKNSREYKIGEFEKIRNYYDYIKKNKGMDYYIDDITWNDVDMDGVFKQMNNTQSSVGEEYLYYMLRKGKNTKEELEEIHSMVSVFGDREWHREDVERVFASIGRTKSISLFDFLHRLGDLGERSNAKHYAMMSGLIASIGLLLIFPPIGVFLFIMFVVINVLNYFKIKKEVDNYFICFNYIVSLIINSKKIAKMSISGLESYSKRILELTENLKEIEKGVFLLPTNSVKESIGELIMEYVRMLFHVDLIKFNSMLKHTLKNIDCVDELFAIMGKIESAYAIASYREMLQREYGFYAIPEFVDESNSYKMTVEEGYHPLIDNPVKNSIATESTVLLTGSNASGKSTFLKMIAINAILSQTIYTSTCKRYVAKMYNIYSSMSLRDNLSGNESYYIVEIKSLKRIIDKIDKNETVLCFVDEVLRGTNTVERIAASAELLKYMYENNVMCYAATHDIELTHILENIYENYHFEELIEDNDVKFNYKLMSGRTRSRNAIKLLGIIGFNDDIIDAAGSRAERFIDTGIWV